MIKDSSCNFGIDKALDTVEVYMSFKFLHLVVGSRDLSHDEKKNSIVTSWATHKMTTVFTQNDNFEHFEWK